MKMRSVITITILAWMLQGCATSSETSNVSLIENPFGAGRTAWHSETSKEESLTLRSRSGDQTFEVQIPERLDSDMVIPLAVSAYSSDQITKNSQGLDRTYLERKPLTSDREIVSSFQSNRSPAAESKMKEIESGLGLQQSDEPLNMDQSYLAKLDWVKQLFKSSRFEAALLELDALLRDYPTSARLFEMRGTIFDRMGYGDLAIRSWKQALELDPNRVTLKKFLERKESALGLSSKMTGDKK